MRGLRASPQGSSPVTSGDSNAFSHQPEPSILTGAPDLIATLSKGFTCSIRSPDTPARRDPPLISGLQGHEIQVIGFHANPFLIGNTIDFAPHISIPDGANFAVVLELHGKSDVIPFSLQSKTLPVPACRTGRSSAVANRRPLGDRRHFEELILGVWWPSVDNLSFSSSSVNACIAPRAPWKPQLTAAVAWPS